MTSTHEQTLAELDKLRAVLAVIQRKRYHPRPHTIATLTRVHELEVALADMEPAVRSRAIQERLGIDRAMYYYYRKQLGMGRAAKGAG